MQPNEHGVNITAKVADVDLALHIASSAGHVEIVRILLELARCGYCPFQGLGEVLMEHRSIVSYPWI